MSDKVEVDLEEIKQVFLFLEDLNAFFHQPMHYETIEDVKEYVDGMYPQLHHLFYHVVWNWLPPTVQNEIEDRPSPFES
jgi:hypothetical protein